ncbi:MAG: 30S ribosomal protein S6 [Pirellulales bacterium]|nr:30S ribosomal protein S6 [Pirellulales bacterium]
MAVHTYECLLVLDSNRYARDAAGVSGQIDKFIKNVGGETLVSRVWEERRLAYPINGHRKGTYWLCYFKVDGNQIAAIERDCQLSDSILRSLILKIDPRVADALVTHARGSAQPKTRAPEPAPTPNVAGFDEVPAEAAN